MIMTMIINTEKEYKVVTAATKVKIVWKKMKKEKF